MFHAQRSSLAARRTKNVIVTTAPRELDTTIDECAVPTFSAARL